MIGSQSGALLLQPVLTDQRAPLLELVPLLGVGLHDISHAVPAECDNVAQLLVPPCLSQSIRWGVQCSGSVQQYRPAFPSPPPPPRAP